MIVRSKRGTAFTIVPNATFEDDRLSFAARGLLAYLLVKPDDWSVSITNLQRTGAAGRDRVYGLLRELIAAGYVVRTQTRTARGAEAVCYTVFDVPQTQPTASQLPESQRPGKPEAGTQLPESQDTGNQLTGNTDALTKNQKAPINQKAPSSNANALRPAARSRATGRARTSDGTTPTRTRPAPKPVNPEDRAGPYRDVFRMICQVRRLDPDMLDGETRSNTRRLAGELCRRGVNDADIVKVWGKEWYADMATRTRTAQRSVTAPSIAQLTTWFGGRAMAASEPEAAAVPNNDDWGWPT